MGSGAYEHLGNALAKHKEEPVVCLHVAHAMAALMAKEKPKDVQKLTFDIVPSVVFGAKAVIEAVLAPLHGLTRDNVDASAFAMRVGCRREWLHDESTVKFDDHGKVLPAQKGGR